ncbi:hypothetical protein Ahy_B04g069225 [Arachis hypogaea]|uniref:GRF-type domain-containing protein n=1 Tax=Arachis hypogaea TaxID=3818 RepID=A0A444ZBZ4_ARAHY|nr:hypothetical protein Ahy_B04g069225 [Arachis hypogaea]
MSSSKEPPSSSIDGKEGKSALSVSVGSVGVPKKKKKFIAPRCRCGAHAILFLSSTEQNPNRLFYRCPHFKSSTSHCKFFAWLDDYVALFEVLPRNSSFMEGWKLDQSQIPNAAVVDAEKLRELEGRVTGLELEPKHCNTNSGTSCVNVKAVVIVFVFGIVISKFKAFG